MPVLSEHLLSPPQPSYEPEHTTAMEIITSSLKLWGQWLKDLFFTISETFVTVWICCSWARASSLLFCSNSAIWIRQERPYHIVLHYKYRDLWISTFTDRLSCLPSLSWPAPGLLSVQCRAVSSGFGAPPAVHLFLSPGHCALPVKPAAAVPSGPKSFPGSPPLSCVLPAHPWAHSLDNLKPERGREGRRESEQKIPTVNKKYKDGGCWHTSSSLIDKCLFFYCKR